FGTWLALWEAVPTVPAPTVGENTSQRRNPTSRVKRVMIETSSAVEARTRTSLLTRPRGRRSRSRADPESTRGRGTRTPSHAPEAGARGRRGAAGAGRDRRSRAGAWR